MHFDVEVNIRVPKSSLLKKHSMQPRSVVPLAMLTLIICLAGDCLHQRNLLSTGRSHRFGNNNVFHNVKIMFFQV